MPIDIRYHAVSLLAVFLALVLGILVGFAMVDPTQMQEFVEMVKKDNERTRTENREELETLRAQQRVSLTFEKALSQLAIAERLQDRRVILLDIGSQEGKSTVPMAREALENAGARIASVVTLKPAWADLPEEAIDRILQARGAAPPETDKRTFLVQRLAQRLVEGGSNLPFYLADEGLLGLSAGSDFGRPVHAVVVVGHKAGEMQFDEQVAEPLLRALKQDDLRIVGCEASEDSGEAVQFFQRLDLNTVDCVDLYPGRVALVLSVAGADGHFGIKPTADRLIPELQ